MTEDIFISAGGSRLGVSPQHGGRLSSLVVGGKERILQRAEASSSDPDLYWGGYLMAPWAGRMDQGRYPAGGAEHQLETSFAEHAIHGVAWQRGWDVVDVSPGSVILSCPLDRGGWPLGGRATQVMRLVEHRLELEATIDGLVSTGPVGMGWHPWFKRPASGDMTLQVPAEVRLEARADDVPTGRLLTAEGEWDLRHGPALGSRRLDVVYARCEGPAVVGWPDLRLTMTWGPEIRTVVVYTPADGVCVEPQSMWPNAPWIAAAGGEETGQVIIGPGESFTIRETWTWGAVD